MSSSKQGQVIRMAEFSVFRIHSLEKASSKMTYSVGHHNTEEEQPVPPFNARHSLAFCGFCSGPDGIPRVLGNLMNRRKVSSLGFNSLFK